MAQQAKANEFIPPGKMAAEAPVQKEMVRGAPYRCGLHITLHVSLLPKPPNPATTKKIVD